MKTAIHEIRGYSNKFKQNWLQYLLLLLSLDLFNQFIVIPLFRYATTFVLQAGAIPFVSYQNVVTIITTNTMVFVVLIIELILLLSIIYAQFAFLLLAIKAIEEQNFHLGNVFKQTWQRIRKIRVGSTLLLTAYFILIMPFADIVFRTPLLSKIQIPEFILDYMTRSPLLLGILIAMYIIIFVMGIRLILTLPIMIFEEKKTWAAMKESWQATRNWNWWKILSRLLLLMLIAMVVLAVFYIVIYLLQILWDLLPGKFSWLMAIFNLSLIQIGSEIVMIWSTIVAFLILFAPLKLKIAENPKKHFSVKAITFTSIFSLILIASLLVTNVMYINGTNSKSPITVSHRGVDDKNGVQNTIPALKKTAKLKPDYVEIDLHETKDKQFVVLHDESLEKLTGVRKIPSQMTLKDLTKLTAKENGHKAKIASFDQYLAAAEKLHQKLLIEIKTTPKDSKKILERFNKKYGQTIIKNKYQVQSLDYRVIEGLHQINPKLFVLYIQPYNFTYPHSVADGYSMEYSTLNSDFIWQAHAEKHPVYAWTINDEKLMKKMCYDQVDGIITDRLSMAQKAIRDFQDNSDHANRVLNYIMVLPTHSELEV